MLSEEINFPTLNHSVPEFPGSWTLTGEKQLRLLVKEPEADWMKIHEVCAKGATVTFGKFITFPTWSATRP